jgi:hypothetical protein
LWPERSAEPPAWSQRDLFSDRQIHDSRLYTVQALDALMGGRFADDLHFLYGTQDQFTLFGLVYQPLLASLGIAKAAVLLTISGQAAWVCGLIYLARGVFDDQRTRWLAVVLSIALPGGIFFEYGEPFLTPRLFAEATTLWALGVMLRGRAITALLLLCCSAVVHPIMTLPGLAVLFVYEANRWRGWWIIAGLAAACCLALACLHIQPFARILVRFDPVWFSIVAERDFFSVLGRWTTPQWLEAANLLVLTALAFWTAEARERPFLLAVLAVALGGLAVTFVGGDLLRNVLIVDAQQYRATWILAVMANVFVAPLLLRSRWNFCSSLTVVALACAGTLLIVTQFVGAQGYLLATPMAAIAGLVLAWEHVRQRPVPDIIRIAGLLLVAAWCGTSLAILYQYLVWIGGLWPERFRLVATGFGFTVAVLVAIGVFVVAGAKSYQLVGRLLLAAAALLLPLAMSNWDQRTPWTRFVETTERPPGSLTSLLPEAKPIYWEGDVRVPWFVLKRASYFSCSQGTGAMFFRGTAISYQHRQESFRNMPTLDFSEGQSCPSDEGEDSKAFTREHLASICASEPGLDTLVLLRPVPGVSGSRWMSPARFEEVRLVDGKAQLVSTDQFFIYSCDSLR